MLKTCSKCKEAKGVVEFGKHSRTKDGLQAYCRQCKKTYQQTNWEKNADQRRAYYQDNRERIAKRSKAYYQANQEIFAEYGKQYRATNREKISKQKKQNALANREKFNEWSKNYRRRRFQTDPLFRLIYVLRCRTRRAKSKFDLKSRTAQILGCSWEDIQAYFIQTTTARYGSCDDFKNYHIDHIIPLSTAINEAEAIALCHYTNLQLLTPEDNRAKSDRLDWQLNEVS